MKKGTKKVALSEKTDKAQTVYLKKLGDRLKHFRKKAGYTSYEYFAYEHGFSRPQYGKYEAGANIQLNTLIKILQALDVSLEEFFKGFD